jgi:FSR family fosmidomycin resistance protein-like MFS transporter
VSGPRRPLALLAAGHASADMCQGAVPALIPFLIAQRGMSFASTTGLLVAMTIASSVLQPLVGLVSDRQASRWLMPAALCCAAAGIALLGVIDGYGPMLLAVSLSGLGVAAFHPDAARRVSAHGREHGATAMSYFAVGGNAGFALAPAAITPAVLLLGLPGAGVVLVPALAVAALLATLESGAPAAGWREARHARAPDRWGPFSRVAGIAVLRSGVYFGLQAFLASYFIEHLGTSQAFGNAALTVMLVAGAAGTLAGGRLADRVDRRGVLGGFMLAIPPLLALLLLAGDATAGAVLVAAIGFVTIGNFSLTVVIGQEYLPGRPALASGITLGLAIGIGGLIAAGLGPLADQFGLPAVLWLLAALPLPAAALAATLPRPG